MSVKSKDQSHRVMVILPPELDRAVLDLRKTEEYCRCSYSAILWEMVAEGAKILINRLQGNGEKS